MSKNEEELVEEIEELADKERTFSAPFSIKGFVEVEARSVRDAMEKLAQMGCGEIVSVLTAATAPDVDLPDEENMMLTSIENGRDFRVGDLDLKSHDDLREFASQNGFGYYETLQALNLLDEQRRCPFCLAVINEADPKTGAVHWEGRCYDCGNEVQTRFPENVLKGLFKEPEPEPEPVPTKTYSATIPVQAEITPEIQVPVGEELDIDEIWERLVAEAMETQERVPWMLLDDGEYVDKGELIKEE